MKNMHLTLPMVAMLGLYGCATEKNTPGTTELQIPVTARPAPQLQAKSPAKVKPVRALDKAPTLPPSPPESQELWDRVDNHIGFAHDVDDSLLSVQMKRYAFNQKYFDRTLGQAALYLPYVLEQVLEAGMPAEIALVPFVESGYSPFAYSPNGAAGLWQIIPGTADHLGLQRNQWYDGRRDIIKSTEAAIRYLKVLNEMFNGDWPMTLAAYNAGPSAVQDAIKKHRKTDFWSLPLRGETQRFVRRIVALSKVVSDPKKYGIDLHPMPEEQNFAIIDLNAPVDLSQVARVADISTDRIYQLNPGFTRWATPPTGSHQLVLPAASAPDFEEKLAALPKQERRAGSAHVVAKGDTLGGIAGKNNISVRQLAAANNIKPNHILSIGQTLQIPSGPSTIRPTQASGFTTYQVKAGDNLWTIARSQNLAVADIAAWNKISPQTTLQPGQTLRLHKKAASKGNNQATNYRVRSGDSLSSIAEQHKVKLRDLISWNNLSASTRLMPGQKLKIFTYH